jgi:hypothetical protein
MGFLLTLLMQFFNTFKEKPIEKGDTLSILICESYYIPKK